MTATAGTTRMVVAGMVLMGGALGMFGEIKIAAVHQIFPRVPRTEHEVATGLRTDGDLPAPARNLSLVAREHSRESDPCVPIAPVSFSARRPEIC